MILQGFNSPNIVTQGYSPSIYIVGSATLVFSPTGAIVGIKQLLSSIQFDFATAGVANGIGALLGVNEVDFSTSGSLNGLGALEGSTDLTYSESAILIGLIPAEGNTNLSFSLAGELSVISLNEIEGTIYLTYSATGFLNNRFRRGTIYLPRPEDADLLPDKINIDGSLTKIVYILPDKIN